ncbi:hypothetical protein [Nocardioides jejuensis]|uniref:Uncharacterized protein n=1 Tax=Nocardioides jejuensis TaxID=2502782 RepID=A0A4R1C066_9ACTN|nr:hypothetical protein [Nocardioides jejuensis]TCJ23035.1 hypothetical protein EPD65_11780 [Nocardioides jejuensis]
MTPTEAGTLLTMASAFDNRKVDPDAAKAWAVALDGLRFDDCRAALIQHYKTSTDWLMPASLRTLVKRLRRNRVLEYGVLPDPPSHLDPDNAAAYIAWQKATTRAIADGNPPTKPAELPARDPGEIRALLSAATKEIPE